ncbi:MAG: DUF3592 domain-containing protein [Verrucomicrobiales bacterium]
MCYPALFSGKVRYFPGHCRQGGLNEVQLPMSEREPVNVISVIGGFFFGSLIAAMGGYFVFALYTGAERARQTRSWVETSCMIVKSQVDEGRPTPNSPVQHRAVVEYEYDFDGKTRRGNRIKRVEGPTSHRERAEGKVADYPVGSSVVCWVNPHAPEEAILRHDSMAPLYTIWFPGLFVVGGVGIAVSSLMVARR